jgi:hypothetical protein
VLTNRDERDGVRTGGRAVPLQIGASGLCAIGLLSTMRTLSAETSVK